MTETAKKKALLKITKQQNQLLRHTIRIAALPPAKKWITSYKRAVKMVGLTTHYRGLEIEKRAILSQPLS